MKDLRSAPPSGEANNQDVFLWALYLLSGADQDVDVEAVYLKSFELAPARLGWRTHPEIPDYKKTAKALQSIEASTHVGLVHRVGPYTRRLSTEGVRWVEKYQSQLKRIYSGEVAVKAPSNNEHERRRRTIRESASYLAYQNHFEPDLFDLADAFECSAASPANVWKGRVDEAARSADVMNDPELAKFVEYVREYMASNGGRNQ
jgi:hypothetical protein